MAPATELRSWVQIARVVYNCRRHSLLIMVKTCGISAIVTKSAVLTYRF